MEYLMTYGWTILIIAIALAALSTIGIFNSNYFAPKAQPGSCKVYRPNGAGSTAGISLEGVCGGELPQYAAQFNGQNSYIGVGNPSALQLQYFTAVAWVNMPINSGNGFAFSHAPIGSSGWGMEVGAGFVGFDNAWVTTVTTASIPNDGNWHQVGIFRASNSTAGIIIDGKIVGTTTYSSTFGFGNFYIGDRGGPSGTLGNPPGNFPAPFNGTMANLQVYNTVLAANSVQNLYQEGIGGAPINILNLVAWWPLNGNATDYSGNGNNGVPANIVFTGSWTNRYTAP